MRSREPALSSSYPANYEGEGATGGGTGGTQLRRESLPLEGAWERRAQWNRGRQWGKQGLLWTLNKRLLENDAKTCPPHLCDHRNTYTYMQMMNLGV